MTPDPAAARAHELLRGLAATLATAESLTGGLLAARLTSVPGASATYLGGIVSYATSVKVALLEVSETLVAEHGVVSAACARAMAEGARGATGATYAVSTTGAAGPDPHDGRPVGTVFIAVAGPRGSAVAEHRFAGDRQAIQSAACDAALAALVDTLVHTGAGSLQREDGALG